MMQRPRFRFRPRVLASLLVVWSVAPAAETVWDDERDRFREAWRAAARADLAAVDAAIDDLGDYPLVPWLEFEALRQRGAGVEASEMTDFLGRHGDLAFADRLEQSWLRALGRAGRLSTLAEHGAAARDAATRCLYLRARRDSGHDPDPDAVRDLWLHPSSRPTECDPLFAWWRRQGQPDAETAWQRFGLAVEAGELRLARYLRRYLPEAERGLADGWIEIARRPATGLSAARGWPDRALARRIAAWGVHRLAGRDWQRAGEWLERLSARFDFSESEIGPVQRRIALFRALDLDAGAIAAIDALPSAWRDQQMLEWRLRAALANGFHDEVLASIAAMPAGEQLSSRWRYWRGRALAELGRPEAGPVLATLAAEPDYYGFLAAARTGQPLTLCPRELHADGEIQRRLLADAEFERALELHAVGHPSDARWTWNRLASRLGEPELRQAALLAAARGWHDRSVLALARAGARDAYRWRFPLVEKERVEQAASRAGVDPALVLGLMRAESAMQPDARSPAGARGLLQLMDGTARRVARKHGIPYSGAADLYRPERNIALGAAHLGDLAEDFDAAWTRVAAAYNAGPRRAAEWDAERGHLDPDIWIETLPFYETRDYVPRVLAFATIYEWQLQRPPSVLVRHVVDPAAPPGRFACPGVG